MRFAAPALGSFPTFAAVVVSLVIAAPAALTAQGPETVPLAAGADPKLWSGYFDVGMKQFKQTPIGAELAFRWASRLDPSRAEPLFAQWAAFLAHQKVEDVRAYFRAEEEILRRPDVRAADSLRGLALVRNPFVHRGLEILIWDRMPGNFSDDRDTRAWIAYSNGDFKRAIDMHTRTIERDDRAALWRRYDRAIAYVSIGDLPSALADLRTLVDELRKQDDRKKVTMYQSKHFLLYMIGFILTEMRRYPEAREAFGESLVEDAAFAYGNAGLAAISRLQRQNVSAVSEYSLAIELAPNDGHLRYLYSQVLFDLQRFDDGAQQLERAIELEPYYPAPLLLLGRLRERQGREDEAFASYERFAALAPANDTQAKNIRLRLQLRAQRSP